MNEKLILATLIGLVNNQAEQMIVDAGFAELLASRLPNMSAEQKAKLLAHSKQMQALAQKQKESAVPLIAALAQA